MTNYIQDPKLRSLAEIATSLGKIKFAKGCIGKQLKILEIKVSQLKVSLDYQRFISTATLKKAKQFNRELCQPLFVALRPDGTYVIVDGQHKGIMAYLAELDADFTLTCLVYEHDNDSTLSECIAKEAKLFEDLNTTRKNTSTLDKVRAGLSYGDEDAISFENNFIAVGVKAEGIGYKNGPEVNGFAKVVESINRWKISNTKQAVDFLYPIYKNQWGCDYIDGSMIGGLAGIFNLIDALGNGKKADGLSGYLKNNFANVSKSKWTENTRGNSDVLIARKIVKKYNDLVEQNLIDGSIIGEDMLSNNKLGKLDEVS
jgi:hypothetical protein